MVRVGLVVRVSLVVGVDWGRVGGRDCLDSNNGSDSRSGLGGRNGLSSKVGLSSWLGC